MEGGIKVIEKNKSLFKEILNEPEKTLIEVLVSKVLNIPINEVKDNIKTNFEIIGNINMDNTSNLLVLYKNEFILFKLNDNYDGNLINYLSEALNLLNVAYKINDNNNKYCRTLDRGVLVNLNLYSKEFKGEKPVGKIVTDWNYPENDESRYQGYCLKIININLEYYANTKYEDILDDEKIFKLFTFNDNDLDNLVKDIPELESYISKLKELSK